MAPFQICVRWSRISTKMAAKLKIEKRGDAIVIVHCCFSISQNEFKLNLYLLSFLKYKAESIKILQIWWKKVNNSKMGNQIYFNIAG
jgi:hypothetical protein